jgi:DNA-binding NtrC family response regulator
VQEPRHADVRLLLSTRVTTGSLAEILRPDLLARFKRTTIRIPALRERRDDIVPLARTFLAEGPVQPPPRLSAEAAELLLEQPWFGNVSDVQLCIEQLVGEIGPETTLVGPELVAPLLAAMAAEPVPSDGPRPQAEESSILQARLRELERQNILRTLSRARGNKTQAARELKIARKTLYERMRKLGIDRG